MDRQIHIFGSHSYGNPPGFRPKGGAYAIVAQRGSVRYEHWGLRLEVNAPALVAHAILRLIHFAEAHVDSLGKNIPLLEIITSCATTISARIDGALRDKAKLDGIKLKGVEPRQRKEKDCGEIWLELAHRSGSLKLGDQRAALSVQAFFRAQAIAKEHAHEAARAGGSSASITLTDNSSLEWLLAEVI